MDSFGYCSWLFDTAAQRSHVGADARRGRAAARRASVIPMRRLRGRAWPGALALLVLVLLACCLAAVARAEPFALSGRVDGLRGRLVLANRGAETLQLTQDGPLRFTEPLADGQRYDVTVLVHATAQHCTVLRGSGVATADVADIRVVCEAAGPALVHELGAGFDGAGWTSAFTEDEAGNLYAATAAGGLDDQGALIRITPWAEESLVGCFASQPDSFPLPLERGPGGRLHGVSFRAGEHQAGMVYRLHDQGGFEVLHNFGATQDAGMLPSSALLHASDGQLYGVTAAGGSRGGGTVYRIDSQGRHSVLHAFVHPLAEAYADVLSTTASDDGEPAPAPLHAPFGRLLELRPGVLVGTASRGGAAGRGGVFAFDLESRQLYALASLPADVAAPMHGLMRASDGRLYGVCSAPGQPGALWRYHPLEGLAIVYRFAADDGAVRGPRGVLVEGHDARLYGIASRGGAQDAGAIYCFDPAEQDFQLLHRFTPASPGDLLGGTPRDGLLLARDGRLYGSTSVGGRFARGAVFRID